MPKPVLSHHKDNNFPGNPASAEGPRLWGLSKAKNCFSLFQKSFEKKKTLPLL